MEDIVHAQFCVGVTGNMKFRANILLNPWVILCGWLVLWAGRLRLIPDYYQRTFELDYYPPEADAIAIPIASNGIMTILLTGRLRACSLASPPPLAG